MFRAPTIAGPVGIGLSACLLLAVGGCTNTRRDAGLPRERARTGATTVATTQYAGIRDDAQRVERGLGNVRLRVSEAGTMHVADEIDRRLIASIALVEGDTIRIEPANDRITVNGQPRWGGYLERRHVHGLYWQPAEPTD